jgi:gamma-glutamyltranspeptidase/glutathione hydrolase
VSTTYRGYTVYKPGFWTQGPVMVEMLNLLDGMEVGAMGHNTATYIHTVTEAMKLAFADRDTYYGDPAFVKVPARLLTKEYAVFRRREIGEKASLEFRPGSIDGRLGRHPALSTVARIDISDALMSGDTTCVDTIDKDGIMFSSTPSGASLPSVIAGDTGIALSHRAQSFFLLQGHPNELAGGKRPRVTLSPTIVVRNGEPFTVLSTPGGDNQDQALLQMFLDMVEFNMNPQQAVEAPRFESRHLVSSFDNHAMSPGELVVDERIPDTVYSQLEAKGHKLERNGKWNGGAAPVMIRMLPSRVIEAGADPYSYRNARAW